MRRIRTTLGAGLVALAVTAPTAGAVTLVSPADGAVITTKTTTLTWALDPATGEQAAHGLDASYPEIFAATGGLNLRDDRDVWTDPHPFLQPTQTTVTSKPLFAGPHYWGILAQIPPVEASGQYTAVPSAVGTYTVKPKILARKLKIAVSRTGSSAGLDWEYQHNLPHYSVKWTLTKNGSVVSSDTKRYRSSERSIYTWIERDEFVGRSRGYFDDGDRLKLIVKITSTTAGVKFSKTFTKAYTVD